MRAVVVVVVAMKGGGGVGGIVHAAASERTEEEVTEKTRQCSCQAVLLTSRMLARASASGRSARANASWVSRRLRATAGPRCPPRQGSGARCPST
ncbi:unnamed protein product [Lampetra fluviatilis]